MTYPPTYLAVFLAIIGVLLMTILWEVLKLVEDISKEKGDRVRPYFQYAVIIIWFITSVACAYIIFFEPWLKF